MESCCDTNGHHHELAVSYTSTIDSGVRKRMSSSMAPEILRSTPLSCILGRCGKIFLGSTDGQAAYEMSEPVAETDWFISHTWSTSRGKKYLALALFFHLRKAMVVAHVFMISTLLLTCLGTLPLHRHRDGNTIGLYSTIVGPATFIIVMLLASDIAASFLPLRVQPRVFLDKTCVHQVDPIMRRQGIESIGSFLHRSRGIVIVYTDHYLQRLWTVYEIASVILLNLSIQIGFIPTFYPTLVFSCMTISLGIALVGPTLLKEATADLVVENRTTYRTILLTCTAAFLWLSTIGAMFVAHNWTKKTVRIYEVLSKFRVRDATCFCEDDRALVNGNVADALRDLKIVAVDASNEQALRVFDVMVKCELPKLISSLFGRAGVSYSYVLVIFLPCVGWSLDAIGSVIYDQAATTGQIVFTMISELIRSYSFWPNLLAILLLSARCGVKNESMKSFEEIMLIVLKGTWVWLACMVLVGVLEFLPDFTWLKALYMAMHLIATPLIYWPSKFKLRHGAKRLRTFELPGEDKPDEEELDEEEPEEAEADEEEDSQEGGIFNDEFSRIKHARVDERPIKLIDI